MFVRVTIKCINKPCKFKCWPNLWITITMSKLKQHEIQETVNACRACLDTKSSNYIHFDTDDGSWSELYQFCTGLSLLSDHGSQLLCHKCADLIKQYAEFKKQCQKSEEFWFSLPTGDVKSLINKIDIKVETQELPLSIEGETYYTSDICKKYKEVDLLKEETVDEDGVSDGAQFDETDVSDDGTSLVKKKKGKIWECKKCHREYKKKKWLVSHVETCNGSIKIILPKSEIFYCGLCEFTSDQDPMKQHLDEHALRNDLNCGSCDFVGKDFASMVSHRYSHHPQNVKKKLYCHLCNAVMRSCMFLQYHYRTEHLKKPGLDCTLCRKSFKTYKSWRNHDRWHRAEKLYICDICGQKFLFRNSIESHMTDHAEFNKYICETCGRGFKRLYGLKTHVKSLHTSHDPVKCPHCDRIFKSEFTLQTHLRFVNKEKPYNCPVCPKKFPSEVTLKNHMFWHSDERPFHCGFCSSKYKAKSQLKIHMRQHTGIMPYKCQHCDKAFASSNQLKVHSSVHTGIRRYKCNYCQRTFHGRKLVEAHCAVQHKDKS